MSVKYDHAKIEKKWQEKWEKEGASRADDNSKAQKEYVLDMFPYPSGSGLHVGHVEGYTATDIYSRYKRMRGVNVLHPMGWDAFGLPAENYAIKTGVHPAKTTEEAITTFRKQIKSLGLSYDWSREVGTHNPSYYKWTQWFFLFLYKNGLAEKRMAKVNWCPKDQTVLANEQTVSESGEKGVCVRCGTKVVQKDLEQWFFKITEFADALHNDLDEIDWPESTKINQRNWIGRSEGAEIDFPVARLNLAVKVFTTRPDTLFGATYMVMAPEHPLIERFLEQAENKKEIEKYVEAAKNKTDLERQEEEKEKTGVEIRGVKAINPANKEEIPIFVADYVLGGYGTGAIMAVPAHDERDMEFAKRFNLPVKEIVLEEPKEITKKVGGKWVKTYRLRDWLISRQRYWGAPIPVVYDPEGKPHPIPEEHLPWILPTDVEYLPKGTSPLATSKELLARTEKIFGKGWKPEADTMDTFVCSSWYFYRFADGENDKEFASKEKIKKWLPVDLYVGGAEHTVLHLLYARFFTKALQKHGYVTFSEPFLKLRHQGLIGGEDGRKMSKSFGNVVNPTDVTEQYGADTLRLYEMFMGPLETHKPWSSKNILGVRRFLERVWRLGETYVGKGPSAKSLTSVFGSATDFTSGPLSPEQKPVAEPSEARSKSEAFAQGSLEILLHQTIKKVSEDIEGLKINTAISSLMILLNAFEDLPAVPRSAYKIFLQLLYPLAPHITSEIWEQLGEKTSLYESAWPEVDESKLKSKTVLVVVQVNGKVRARIELKPDATEEEALRIAQSNEGVQKWLALGKVARAVYVPGKVISFAIVQNLPDGSQV